MKDRATSYKALFSVSLPLVLSMAATTVMEFTDRVFLSNYSIDAIAAALPAGIAAFLFGLVLAFARPADVDAYIVQGSDLGATRQAVEKVGGTVTHELGIIRAVGADLTARQVEALRALPGVRRVYVNSGVGTSRVDGPPLSTDVAGAPVPVFDDRKVIWPIRNAGAGDAFIERVQLQWPGANGGLDKLKHDGNLWSDGGLWSDTLSETATIDTWVPQE